jgi:uroporphyrinogen-III decarboxylase
MDVINAHDDYGTADRMMMRPEQWRELIKPHLKRLVDACHEEGLLYQHHSCGFVEPILEDLAEIGVDAIDTLQACNTHLPEIKKKIGDRLTFCGGFDNQHVLDVEGVSPEAVKQEYRRVIDSLAPGGSYVIYPITGTFEFVGPFLEEHFQYGMGFYADPEHRTMK